MTHLCALCHILEPFGQLEDRLTDLYVKRYSWVFSEVLIEEIMALMSRESGFKIWHQIGSYIQLTITDNDRV